MSDRSYINMLRAQLARTQAQLAGVKAENEEIRIRMNKLEGALAQSDLEKHRGVFDLTKADGSDFERATGIPLDQYSGGNKLNEDSLAKQKQLTEEMRERSTRADDRAAKAEAKVKEFRTQINQFRHVIEQFDLERQRVGLTFDD